MVDGMIVSVALPAIQRELGFSAARLQWVVTAYTVTLGAFLLVGGRAADLLGRRRVFVAGLALFAAASLVAGLARTQALLLGARAAAGLGAALAIPAALALVTAMFRDGRARNRALGLMSATIDVGMAAGAVLGGVIVSALGWPWVFFLVVPFAAAAALTAPTVVAGGRSPSGGVRLGAAGSLAIAGAVGLLVVALVLAEEGGVGSTPALAATGLSAALFATFVGIERRSSAPLIPVELLRSRRGGPTSRSPLTRAASAQL